MTHNQTTTDKAMLMMHMKACFPEMQGYSYEHMTEAIELAMQVTRAYADFVQDADDPHEFSDMLLGCN